MSTAAVICEFNPFHNGHKFLLEKIKSEYAEDVICVMSGSFVQRGDIAITDKYSRARAALKNGADMIAELPTAYALAPAQAFALNGVRMARELKCGSLCFGAENSIEELYAALDSLENEETQAKIAELMKAGDYYPRALSAAVPVEFAGILSKPNNILALEYIRACRKYGIEPIAIQRIGAGHDSGVIKDGTASATKIRELIQGGGAYSAYTPMTVDRPAYISGIESAVLYRLKTMTPAEIARIADVSEGLENRIAEVAVNYNSLSEILTNLKTKRYTMARLRRILLCALLDITAEIQRAPVPYLRILGVRADKKRLITSETLPIIADVRAGYDRLDNSAKEIFNIDLRAAELMNIAAKASLNEFSHGLIIE